MIKRIVAVLMATQLLTAPALGQQTTQEGVPVTTQEGAPEPAAQKTQEELEAEKKAAEERAIEAHRKAFFERLSTRKGQSGSSDQ